MNCKNCGAKLKANAKFCHACGTTVDYSEYDSTTVVVDGGNNYNNQNNNYNPNMNTTPQNNAEGEGLAIASVVLGGLSFLIGGVIVILPIIGLILGICQKKKCTLKTVGIILNSVALALIVLLWIFLIFVFSVVGGIAASEFDDFEDRIYDSYKEETSDYGESLDKFKEYFDIENEDTSKIEDSIEN